MAHAATFDPGPSFHLRFTLGQPLGRGASGEVYLAQSRIGGASLALKVLAAGLAGDALARFDREYQALRQLDHPCVMAVLDRGEHMGRHWILLEYLGGGCLRERLDLDHRPSLEEAVRLAADILSGLAACHQAGILHRDLKPANVLLTTDGRAKIGDLGLARDEKRVTQLTATGGWLGTPLYMQCP